MGIYKNFQAKAFQTIKKWLFSGFLIKFDRRRNKLVKFVPLLTLLFWK